MKWFFKWLAKKCQQAMSDNEKYSSAYEEPLQTIGPRRLNRYGMNFTIYTADTGGFIVEYTSNDPRTGKGDSRLHIINDEADLAKNLSHIITIETLRA